MASPADISADAPRSRRHAPIVRLIGESVAWGVLTTVAALFALVSEQAREFGPRVVTILAVYFVGGVIGYPFAFAATHWFARRFSAHFKLLFAVAALAGFTLAATAGILAFDYRAYYAEWHDAFFSRDWFYQQFYTALGSTYQYLVIGIRLYWPLGPIFLILAGWWMTRRTS